MVDQKTPTRCAVRSALVNTLPGRKLAADARVVHSRLKSAAELAIDDSDYGTDPYNRTGRFTVLKRD